MRRPEEVLGPEPIPSGNPFLCRGGMGDVYVTSRRKPTTKVEGAEHMKKMMKKMLRKVKGQSGQSLVEYALILALISVVAILVLRGIGTSVNTKLSSVNSNLQ